MRDRRYRVLFVASHPTQYSAPLFRSMAQHSRLEPLVAYCSLQGAAAGIDLGFGIDVAWDIPLLEGYPWVRVPNKSYRPGFDRFFALLNPGLWKLVRRGGYDAVVVYTGYAYASFWIAAAAARASHTPLLFGTDATSLRPRDKSQWKVRLKKLLLPAIFRLATIVIVPSLASRQFIRSLGIPDERIVLTPFVVDNNWWRRQAEEVNRPDVRRKWGIPDDALVVLCCAKLQHWKRPQDVLRAFARARVENSYLVFAGEGPLRAELEAEALCLGVGEHVRFLGFVNQSRLPSAYRTADLFMLASEYDPCPVVVCEAMLCGCPVVISDEIRGRFELVEPGETGFIYPCGNLEALSRVLVEALADRGRLRAMGTAALQRMETWSPRENIEAFLRAMEKACALRS